MKLLFLLAYNIFRIALLKIRFFQKTDIDCELVLAVQSSFLDNVNWVLDGIVILRTDAIYRCITQAFLK